MKINYRENKSRCEIITSIFLAFVFLFIYGFGVYLTILAGIGAGPWDVFNLGIANTFGILYGNASIAVSLTILLIDIAMKESIGIAMFVDAITVGKAVDLFNRLAWVPLPKSLFGSILLMVLGLVIMNFSVFFYMLSALGCGPRDTLLVGLKRRTKKIPIGAIGVTLHVIVTIIGYLLGGPVGIGTVIYAVLNGTLLQLVLWLFDYDLTAIRHQNIIESAKILFRNNQQQAVQ